MYLYEQENVELTLPCLSQNSPTSFGGLHTTLLGFSTAVLSEQDWVATIQPINDDEQADVEAVILGTDPQKKVDDQY